MLSFTQTRIEKSTKKASSVVGDLSNADLADMNQLPSLDFDMTVECSTGLFASMIASWNRECLKFQDVQHVNSGLTLTFSIRNSQKYFCLHRESGSKKAHSWIQDDNEKTFSDAFTEHIAFHNCFMEIPVIRPADEYRAVREERADKVLAWSWPVRTGEPRDQCTILEVSLRPSGEYWGAGLFDYNWLALPDWEAKWHLKVLQGTDK